ncbi:MAG TPA: 2-hydroxyacid dehydrogenase [Gammaproteobacteria bacterium]|nr:2-hydroxyacid dehydrogenase [Gammaproteobacteria bacterium]
MKVLVFSAQDYDRQFLDWANQTAGHQLRYLDVSLDEQTVKLINDTDAVCIFVNDDITDKVAQEISARNVKSIALRCAGFNNVDLEACQKLGIRVVRVPDYSPYAVAEHALALMMALNRGIHKAYCRVREGNFSLQGLMGFDMHGLVVGIIGTGKIGSVMATIINGLGCRVLAYDPVLNTNCSDVEYVDLASLYAQSDIITMHCPLNCDTRHMIDRRALQQMKKGVMLINTSRGAIIDTRAMIEELKRGQVGYLGIDVYEQEGDLFFRDLSNEVIQDDVFERLLTFPNVLITGHQAFFTRQAMENIARTTLNNLSEIEQTGYCGNEVGVEKISVC